MLAVTNKFTLVFPVFFVLTYFFLWMTPIFSQRITLAEAQIQVKKICAGTSIDEKNGISEIIRQDWYDPDTQDLSMNKYLLFVYDRYEPQLLAKGIIHPGSRAVTYDDISKYCKVH